MKRSSMIAATVATATLIWGGPNRANADNMWVSCKPVESAAFPQGMRVKCEKPVGAKFWFFASDGTDPHFTALALSVVEAAELADKFINIFFDPTDGWVGLGCTHTDCRRLTIVTMTESPVPTPDVICLPGEMNCGGF